MNLFNEWNKSRSFTDDSDNRIGSTKFSTEIFMAESKPDPTKSQSDKDVKAPNLFERAKEEIEAVVHTPRHHKETHGTSDDIDENTPIDEVKGPSVFERAKEEIEAIVGSILPKKDKSHNSSS